MTMLSVVFMAAWASLVLESTRSGVGWGKGTAAAFGALFGTAFLAHNTLWAVGYMVKGAFGFHCLLNGALMLGTVLLAARGQGAVRTMLAVASLAPAAGFYLIVKAARKARGSSGGGRLSVQGSGPSSMRSAS